MEELKQVILVRADLKMSKGKTAVQVAHGAVDAVLKSNKKLVEEWRKTGMKKVVLKVNNENELLKFLKIAKEKDIVTALIKDAGRTELTPNTTTVLAIGPDSETKIDSISSELSTL